MEKCWGLASHDSFSILGPCMVIGKKKGGMIPGLLVLIGHDRLITTEIYLNLSPEGVIREFKEK